MASLFALGGAVLVSVLPLLMWRRRRYQPERQALASLFRSLSQIVSLHPSAAGSPPATADIEKAQNALSSLARNHSIEAECYLSLLNQAERIRLVVLMLSRIRIRLAREANGETYAVLLSRATGLIAAGLAAMLRDARVQLDALIGQLRAAASLASDTAPEGPLLSRARSPTPLASPPRQLARHLAREP